MLPSQMAEVMKVGSRLGGAGGQVAAHRHAALVADLDEVLAAGVGRIVPAAEETDLHPRTAGAVGLLALERLEDRVAGVLLGPYHGGAAGAVLDGRGLRHRVGVVDAEVSRPLIGLRMPAHHAGVRVGSGDHPHLEGIDAVPGSLRGVLDAVLPDVAHVGAFSPGAGRLRAAAARRADARGRAQGLAVEDLEGAELVDGVGAGEVSRVVAAFAGALVLVDLDQGLHLQVPLGVGRCCRDRGTWAGRSSSRPR